MIAVCSCSYYNQFLMFIFIACAALFFFSSTTFAYCLNHDLPD